MLEEIKYKSGRVLKVIDGEYVIGGGSPCKGGIRKGVILGGEYFLEKQTSVSDICNFNEFHDWYYANFNWNITQDLNYLYFFSNHSITTIPESICSMKNVVYMSVYDVPLITLPNSIGELSKLQNLYLNQTDISSFPQSFSKLQNLNLLSIYYNNHQLPKNTFLLPNLITLDLRYTQTSDLTGISNLKTLKSLILVFNKISSLPDEICDINLDYLFIFEPSLENLNECIFHKDLLQFGLYSPLIKTLPDIGEEIENINLFWIIGTGISSIPESIGNLKKLQNLEISNNTNLTTLPDSISNLDGADINVILTNNNFSDDYKEYIKNNLFPIANQNGHLQI